MAETLKRAVRDETKPVEKFHVSLSVWSGPYDLLLQVIEEQNLNLLDLNISVLLEHYLRHLENLSEIDIDEAGEFLVVAATLAQIKSKLLLPKEEISSEEPEKDPREELVRYLLEYQKIKQAAVQLGERPLLGRDVFLKGAKEVFQGFEGDGRGTLFQLVKGFQRALRELQAQQPLAFLGEPVSVSERMQEIFLELRERRELEFQDILGLNSTKMMLIASFLAVLELARLKKIGLFQSATSEKIFVRLSDEAKDDLNVESEFDREPEKEGVEV